MRKKIFQVFFFLIPFIIFGCLGMIADLSAQEGYTTEITQRFTTLVASTRTTTLETTMTTYVTRTVTTETYIETQRVVMSPTTVLVPTQRVIFVSQCDNPPCAIGSVTIYTYVPIKIQSPTTVKSLITSTHTTTETIQLTLLDKILKTETELITFTLENVYTSIVPLQTTIAETGTTGSLLSDNLIWILAIIIIIMIAALITLARRPKTQYTLQRKPGALARVYCVNCGAPISAEDRHCPKCGAAQ